MSFIKKIIRLVAKSIIRLFGRAGIDIQLTKSLKFQIQRIQSTTNLKSRLVASEKLVNENQEHPLAHLQLAQALHSMNDIKEFDQMEKYAEVKQDWDIRTGLSELDIEFIPLSMVIGAFGNHYALEGLLRANKYGLRPTKKLFLLLPENAKLRNPALFSYFEPYINIIRDSESIEALKHLESLMSLPLGLCLPFNDGCPFLDIAANQLEKERVAKNLDPAIFTLSDTHKAMGKKALQKLGLPNDAWFVTLHVREPGYRGETQKNTTEDFRNASPQDYIKAIEAVTNSGGWVFRMGDASMSELPSMPKLIDYAHHEIRSDWMDIFLGATCSFCIGTSSGFFRVPRYFGVPVLFTNCSPTVEYFSLMKHDLALFCLRKYKNTNKYLSFQELLSPPISMYYSSLSFENAGLESVKNTSEELEAATKEMILRIQGNNLSEHNDLQKQFKIIAEMCGQKYGNHSVEAFSPISQDFLYKHSNLLEKKN